MRDDDKTTVHSVGELLVPEAQIPCLVVIGSPTPGLVGSSLRLSRLPAVIGRDEDASLRIVDDGISRRHVLIDRNDHGFQLLDLGSTNGTYLNGRRVQNATLQEGDRVQVGRSTVLKFTIQDLVEDQYQQALYDRATRDGLTGVYNKKYFEEALHSAFCLAQRHRTPLSLAMIDLDHFKRINDTFGHPAGDMTLRETASALLGQLRQEDLLARYGGEEFALLLRDTDGERARLCAERCRDAISRLLLDPQGQRIRVTVSIGVASLPEDSIADADALVVAADQQLYEAKHLGRNRVEVRRPTSA